MSTLPFYRTEARQQALVKIAFSWLGTPFRENCAIRGPQGGVSCERFQAALHKATRACPPVELPTLPVEHVRHWHEHHAKSRVLQWLELPEVRRRVQRVDDGEAPMVGDLVVVRVKQTEHHLGVWCGHWIVHVAIPAGVVKHSVHDRELRSLIRCFYRIYEPADALRPLPLP